MNIFLKIVAATLIGLIMYIVLSKQNKDFSMLLSIAICSMILAVIGTYIGPILDFILKLESFGGLDSEITGILLRCVGVGIISEITAMLCNDAGNSSLAKTVSLSASIIILYMCLPLFEGLLDLISGVLIEV